MSEILIDIEESEGISLISNPFPGLRPFGIDESHLFFGREGQTDEVLLKLSENKFVAVIGSSGSGKSSFMYCGVIPILYGGFFSQVGSNWEVIVSRPGNSPIQNLAKSIIAKDEYLNNSDPEEKLIAETINTTILRSSSKGLTEAIEQNSRLSNKNILILIDQFEELFRFKKSEESNSYANESLEFVNLILDAVHTKESKIYVALTMRSDFIGECAQYPELTKIINDSHYLIPQMNREQKRLAIEGPVAVGGGKISPRLTQALLNDLGDNPDQLPILQHALMRTWSHWKEKREEGETYIDLQHYEAVGKMAEALSQHANEAYDELSNSQKLICESLFKTLTEKTGDTHGIRRPTRLDTIAQISGATEGEVIEVIEKFRQAGRSLLMPSVGITLNSNTVIDISHESLMRIWVRLKVWVDEEGEAVQMYLRLSDAAAMYQTGKTGLWRQPDLQLALNWQEKNKPSLVWAQRYNPAFERTILFLETSKKAFETEIKVKEMLQKRMLKRTRMIAIVLGAAAIVSLFFLVFAFMQKAVADQNLKEAMKQKELALSNEKEALKQKEIAEQQKEIAEKQKELAIQSEMEALHQKEIAEQQTQLAMINEKEAIKQKGIALDKEREAISQKLLAIASEKEATTQKSLAEKNAQEAYRLRLLSIAQSMAVKSVQIGDTMKRALLAQQAHIFNSNNGGNPLNNDIYNGLYYALKLLKDQTYNSLKGHENAVRTIVHTPDGKTMFTGGSDGKVLKWNSDNSAPIEILYKDYVIRSLAVSSDNKWLAVAGENSKIQLINISDEQAVPKTIKVHKGHVWALAFTPDGSGLISTGTDSIINHYHIASDKSELIGKSNERIRSLSHSKDGKYLAAGTENGKIVIFNRHKKDSETILRVKGSKRVNSLAFTNNSKYIALGDEAGFVRVWDVENKKLVSVLSGSSARINDLKFNHDDSMLASASFDGSVKVYNMKKLTDQPLVLKDHDSWVWALSFSPDGKKLIAGCVDNLIRVWPTNVETMSSQICDKLNRNMSKSEWEQYVAEDIAYEHTCPGKPVAEDKIEE
jgi:WD40 repeat protein/energy-coupling factor transporter ATP-binding protein EcfA2